MIAIRPSNGDVKPGSSLGAFRKEQDISWHWISPSPFLSSSSHTTQLHYTNSYTYRHPNLNFLWYTIQILVPHIICPAQAVHELKIDHTQHHLSALCIGTHTHLYITKRYIPFISAVTFFNFSSLITVNLLSSSCCLACSAAFSIRIALKSTLTNNYSNVRILNRDN